MSGQVYSDEKIRVWVSHDGEDGVTVMVIPQEGYRGNARYTQPLGSPVDDFSGGQSFHVRKVDVVAMASES